MKLLYTLFILAMSQGVSAQQTLSLQQCRDKAIEHNKSLSTAKVTLEKMGYDVKTMKANFFPKLGINVTDFYGWGKSSFSTKNATLPIYSYNPTLGTMLPNVLTDAQGNVVGLSSYAELPSLELGVKTQNVFTAGLSLVQPIYMGGKISAGYKMTKIGRHMAATNVRLTENEVILSVDEAYTMVIRAKELGEVAKSYRELLLELQKNVDAAVKHGIKLRNDQLKVQVKLNEAELAVTRAENGVRLATMNLCHAIGLPLTEHIDVDVNTINTDGTTMISNASLDVTSRPEYDLLQSKTELAAQGVKLAKSDIIPNLALFGNVGYTNGGNITLDAKSQLLPEPVRLMDKKLVNNVNGMVGLTLNVPIPVFGDGANKVHAAKAQARIARMEQENLQEMMTLELAQAINNLNERITEVGIMQKSVEHAADNMNTSKHLYDVGQEPLSDYMEAQAMWQKAKADEIESRCQLFLALTKYKKAAGILK